MLAELTNKVAALEARLNQVIRPCQVVSVQDAAGTVRVRLPDSGNMVSQPLPVLVRKSQDDKDYWLPDVGEQVLCVFLPTGLEEGFVLGSFYQKVDAPPVTSRDKWRRQFKDGTYLEYDRGSHELTAHIAGSASIVATGDVSIESQAVLKLKAPDIHLEGNLTATGTGGLAGTNNIVGSLSVVGDIDATGTIIDAGGNTNHHNH